ncbi:hypothetical protein DYB38_005770 [Aphanomyces astaci]|uniref:Uncharacterized protein n=1 Tax=Aphanomyces astaci TaxID=112090 RepID=A0A397FF28_APHAT|nr:hypothetical protein DYB36_000416 [Aphanomyces astaci]RHY50335.1 hypothetical protein DYB38_005770 [Aphanomyces astaci]RHY53484.1 hypothetical protein DYB34_006160 [Aphanomyces astaci]RHZ22695.1 hypothetical protein DYB31_000244 [Aphanomyces astaci]
MYSLDVKRLQDKKQRDAAWINKKLSDDSPRAKESRIQRVYAKKYIPHGKYRGGGDCLVSPVPPDPIKPFDHGSYDDPVDSPFRRRAKTKEIQGPLRYNTVIREYPDIPHDFDSTWIEPKPLPQWRFPDPSKWSGGEFGATFNSRDVATSLLDGIGMQKHAPSIAATERFVVPRRTNPPFPVLKKGSGGHSPVCRAKSAPHEKLYMNSLLSANTAASHMVLRELSPHKHTMQRHQK